MQHEFEANFLERVLEPVARCLTREGAANLVGLRAGPAEQERINFLADKNSQGTLTGEERGEYEAYVSASNLLAIFQAQARRILAGARTE